MFGRFFLIVALLNGFVSCQNDKSKANPPTRQFEYDSSSDDLKSDSLLRFKDISEQVLKNYGWAKMVSIDSIGTADVDKAKNISLLKMILEVKSFSVTRTYENKTIGIYKLGESGSLALFEIIFPRYSIVFIKGLDNGEYTNQHFLEYVLVIPRHSKEIFAVSFKNMDQYVENNRDSLGIHSIWLLGNKLNESAFIPVLDGKYISNIIVFGFWETDNIHFLEGLYPVDYVINTKHYSLINKKCRLIVKANKLYRCKTCSLPSWMSSM